MQDSRFKIQGFIIHFLTCVLYLMSCVFTICAQEEKSSEKDKITDLPPVKIEIVDTTTLKIPKERFQSYTSPDSKVYVPLSKKERPWYFPDTSIPEKLGEKKSEVEKGSLFSLSAQAGAPLAFSYQMLMLREFSGSEALLDIGRTTLKSERTSDKNGDSNADKLKGVFAYQGDRAHLKADIQYNARDMDYLDQAIVDSTDSRSLSSLAVDLGYKLPGDAWSFLEVDLSNLRISGPLSFGKEKGLYLSTDLGVKAFWPSSNPVEGGLSADYFAGESDVEEFKEAVLRLYMQDNYIRLWAFVLGAGAEFMADTYKADEDKRNWDLYVNPRLSLTAQLGIRTVLQLKVERDILRNNFNDLYLHTDCLRFNPALRAERSWDLVASLQYRLTRKFTGTLEAFDKEIRELTVFEKKTDEVLCWKPESWDSARIYGFSLGWESLLMDGRFKHSFEYIHEFHDRRIPYRPKNKGNLTVTYLAPFGLEPSLSCEFYGVRNVDKENDKSLSSYFLFRPWISRDFGKNVNVFLTAAIYTGEDEYQIWEDYKLPEITADFGLKLKF